MNLAERLFHVSVVWVLAPSSGCLRLSPNLKLAPSAKSRKLKHPERAQELWSDLQCIPEMVEENVVVPQVLIAYTSFLPDQFRQIIETYHVNLRSILHLTSPTARVGKFCSRRRRCPVNQHLQPVMANTNFCVVASREIFWSSEGRNNIPSLLFTLPWLTCHCRRMFQSMTRSLRHFFSEF